MQKHRTVRLIQRKRIKQQHLLGNGSNVRFNLRQNRLYTMFLETKYVTRDIKKGGHYIIIKESIQQEDIIFNIQAPNNKALNYIKHEFRKLKREIDNLPIVEEFNIILSIMDKIIRQNFTKNIMYFNSFIKQLYLISIRRTRHPMAIQ